MDTWLSHHYLLFGHPIQELYIITCTVLRRLCTRLEVWLWRHAHSLHKSISDVQQRSGLCAGHTNSFNLILAEKYVSCTLLHTQGYCHAGPHLGFLEKFTFNSTQRHTIQLSVPDFVETVWEWLTHAQVSSKIFSVLIGALEFVPFTTLRENGT